MKGNPRPRECRNCGHRLPDPLAIFRLPKEIDSLADALELAVETVTAMIHRGEIPVRRAVDRNGRPYGPKVVLLIDALTALQGSRRNIQ